MRTHGGSFHIFVILLRECTMLKAVVRPNYKLLLSIRIQLTSERATSQKLNASSHVGVRRLYSARSPVASAERCYGLRRTYRACRVRRVWCVYCTLYVVAVRSAVTDAPRWARPTPGARPSAPRGGPC